MKRLIALGFGVLALAFSAAPASAAEGFYFGEETKGVTVSANESDMNIRVRLQSRLDFGDLITSKDGKSYSTTSDLYIRRARIEMGGSLLSKTIKYNLTLSADKWEKIGNTNSVKLFYAYVAWEPGDEFNLMMGKQKLPYSRVSLSSSAKQLLIERPVSTEAAKSVFGKTDAYYQPKLAAYGKFLDGIVAYEVALADGWSNGEVIHSSPARTVFKSNPVYAARVELSPPGWVEKSKSDAHLGKGQHLSVGLNYVNQGGIEYTVNDYSEDRSLWGFDVSGHYKGLTAQFEYNDWKVDSEDPAVADTNPKGWYAQAGYFIDGLNIEPVARYESYDQDSNSSDKTEENTTLGVNWYGKGHSFKVGANWVHTKYDTNASGRLSNDDKKDVYQVQAQMYF